MKKVEHGKTFDRNAANPPAFEIFHNTVTEGYPEHWHTAIEIIMPTRGEYEVVVGKDSYNLKEGDIIGMDSQNIVAKGEKVETVTKELVDKMMDSDVSNITLYFGNNVTEEEAGAIAKELTDKYKRCDVDIHFGGQPLYYYIVSLE